MILKSTMKYIYIAVFLIYSVVTVNILSWIGSKDKLSQSLISIQGPIRKLPDLNDTRQLSNVYNNKIDDNNDAISRGFSETDEQNRIMSENSMKRKRKILAEIIQEYHKSKQTSTGEKHHGFVSIANISIFSAFYDDRENLDLDSPVIRMMGIAPLDSTESLVCRYTNNGIDSWILAQKYEMCENHGKKYGGFMFLCKSPKDVIIVPKKIYIKSLTDLGDNSKTGNDTSIGLDIVPIKRRKVDQMLYQYQYDSMLDDDDNLSPSSMEDRQLAELQNDYANRKPLSIRSSSTYSIGVKSNSNKNGSSAGNNGIFTSDMDKHVAADDTLTKSKLFKMAACIPPLFGTIQLSSLIQFIEFLKLQGVNQIVVYVMAVSKDVESTLQFYKDQGIISMVKWTLPPNVENSIWYNGQIVTIQDCLYRTMGHFDYVAFLDIDELIIPKTDSDWSAMLQRFEKEFKSDDYSDIGGYRFKSAFFNPEPTGWDKTNSQKYKLSFLKSIYRTQTFSQTRTKLIVQPEYIIEMGIHHISQPLFTLFNISTKDVAIETGSIHHFRSCTTHSDERMICAYTVKDTSILKYADTLATNYQKTVKSILKKITTK